MRVAVRTERFEIGYVDFDSEAFHDQLDRKHDTSAVLVTNHDALHAGQGAAADPGPFANIQEGMWYGIVQVHPAAERLNLVSWQGSRTLGCTYDG